MSDRLATLHQLIGTSYFSHDNSVSSLCLPKYSDYGIPAHLEFKNSAIPYVPSVKFFWFSEKENRIKSSMEMKNLKYDSFPIISN